MNTIPTPEPDDSERRQLAAQLQAIGRALTAKSAQMTALAEAQEAIGRRLCDAGQSLLVAETEADIDAISALLKEAAAKSREISRQCRDLAKMPLPF